MYSWILDTTIEPEGFTEGLILSLRENGVKDNSKFLAKQLEEWGCLGKRIDF